MDDSQVKLQAVQAKTLEKLSAIASEHFEHFAIVVIPGGGGDPLRGPQWTYSGNKCALVGAIDIAKLHIVGAIGAKKTDGNQGA